MKLKHKYSFQKYENKYLAIVDFTEINDDKRLLWVNECGKAVMELLQDEMTKEELVKKISEKYVGDAKVIEKSVGEFIEKLITEGLLLDM